MDSFIWMQSHADWMIFFIAALFIGMSKTGGQSVTVSEAERIAYTVKYFIRIR